MTYKIYTVNKFDRADETLIGDAINESTAYIMAKAIAELHSYRYEIVVKDGGKIVTRFNRSDDLTVENYQRIYQMMSDRKIDHSGFTLKFFETFVHDYKFDSEFTETKETLYYKLHGCQYCAFLKSSMSLLRLTYSKEGLNYILGWE